jgi:hypothetical protein
MQASNQRMTASEQCQHPGTQLGWPAARKLRGKQELATYCAGGTPVSSMRDYPLCPSGIDGWRRLGERACADRSEELESTFGQQTVPG